MLKPVLLLCCIAIAMAGCASKDSPPVTTPPPNLGTLEWGVVGVQDVPTLDPALVSDPTSISMASLIYGGLVRLDDHLRVRPDGAARWTIGNHGKTYTFRLRKGLRFASGRTVTAADFATALRRALGPDGASGPASFYLGDIAKGGIQALSTKTLSITLNRPSAHFLAELAFPASFVPDPALIGRYGANWTDHAAGFGPYSVAAWNHTRSLVLRRNPYYWAGKAAFPRIKVHLEAQSTALAAYRQGSLDLVSGLQPGQNPGGLARGVRHVAGLALDYLAFNTARLPFYRLNARRAFAAVWHPSLASSTSGQTAFPATGFLPSAFGIHSPPWKAAHSPSVYLAAARYPRGKGFPSISLIVPRDAGVDALATALTDAWQRQLGVYVSIRHLDPSVYDQVLSAHHFDIALVRWGADYADPQDFLGTQLGSSGDNLTGWSTPKYNAAVRLADSYAPDDPRRIALYRTAARLAARKLPLLPLDEPALAVVMRPEITGLHLTPLGTITGDWPHVYFGAQQ